MSANFPNSLGLDFSNLCLINIQHGAHLGLILVVQKVFSQSTQGIESCFTLHSCEHVGLYS